MRRMARFVGERVYRPPSDPVKRLWLAPQSWPSCPNYTFLAEAFHRVGRARFASLWHDGDPLEVTAPEPPISEQQAQAKVAKAVTPDIAALLQGVFAGVRQRHPGRVAAYQRAQDVRRFIATACASGQLVSAWRAVPGGMAFVLPPNIWITENIAPRFATCQISRADPFNPNGSDRGWLFISTASLDALLTPNNGWPAQPDADIPASGVDRADPSRLTSKDEERAIQILAARLDADPHMKKAHAKAALREANVHVSGIGFQARVWPKARKKAGLTERAPPGPRKTAPCK